MLAPSLLFGGGKTKRTQRGPESKKLTMFEKLKKKYLRWKARRTLLNQYEYVMEVDHLLEDYLSSNLLRGGSAEFMKVGRENLVKKQGEIKTNREFIQFLQNYK